MRQEIKSTIEKYLCIAEGGCIELQQSIPFFFSKGNFIRTIGELNYVFMFPGGPVKATVTSHPPVVVAGWPSETEQTCTG